MIQHASNDGNYLPCNVEWQVVMSQDNGGDIEATQIIDDVNNKNIIDLKDLTASDWKHNEI